MNHKEDLYWLGLTELHKRFPKQSIADIQASVDKYRREDKALTSSAMILAAVELENPNQEIQVDDSNGLAWFISKEGEGEKFITEYDNPLIKEGCNVNNEVKKRTLVVNTLYTAKTSLGIQFDQSDPEGSPLEVRKGTLIEGLIITLLDMKLKEKRTVIVPAYLGFTLSHDASKLGINTNDALQFELEILEVQQSKNKNKKIVDSVSIENGRGIFKPSVDSLPLPPHWQPPSQWKLPDDWLPPESWGLPEDWKMKKS